MVDAFIQIRAQFMFGGKNGSSIVAGRSVCKVEEMVKMMFPLNANNGVGVSRIMFFDEQQSVGF